MKRFTLSVFALASLILTSNAEGLTPAQALQRASRSAMRKTAAATAAGPQLAHTINTAAGEAAVYVFNSNTRDGGYLLLSADDIAAPVLGYADSGSFDAAAMPPQMRWWLEQYARQIEYGRQQNLQASQGSATRAGLPDIAPMVTTKWNQDAPYNNDCPIYPATGERSMTGCVATAMAQVVNFWKTPVQASGSISYTPSGFYTPLKMELGAQKFDWENMLDQYHTGKYTDAQAAAVAYLMKACGYSVNMDYSSKASGALSHDVGNALRQNFGYNPNMSYELRDYYTMTEWNEMVYGELAAGRPVLYAGLSDGGGHEFVCDGYANGYFHINWGWGGMSDGYFLLQALNPDSEGIGGGSGGFNYRQDIMKGVQPSVLSNPGYMMLFQNGALTASVSGSKISPRLTGGTQNGIWYYQYYKLDCNIGMEIAPVDKPADKTYVSLMSASLNAYNGLTSLQSFNFPAALADGRYRCTLVMRKSGGTDADWQPMRHNPGLANYFYVTKGGSTLKVETIPVARLQLTAGSIAGKFYYECYTTVNATFVNPSDSELSTSVMPVVVDANGQAILEGAAFAVTVAPGDTATISTRTVFGKSAGAAAPTTATEGMLKFKNKITGAYYDIETPVTIQVNHSVAPSVTNFTITGMSREKVEDKNNVWIVTDPTNMKCSFTLTNRSGYFGYPIYIYVADPETNLLVQTTPLTISPLEANKSVICKGTMNFTTGEENKLYLTGAVYYGPVSDGSSGYLLLSQTYMTVRRQSAVENIDADIDAPAEYFNLQGAKVANPGHGIFIRRQGGKTEKVVL